MLAACCFSRAAPFPARDGVSFLRDRHNDSEAVAGRGGIVRGLQEGATVEWDIWSHRAIQQSLASAAHTNG